MRKFRVIESSRLSELSMAKLYGGRPCTSNDCGIPGGYTCNSGYGPTNPCPSFISTGPAVCPVNSCSIHTCFDNSCLQNSGNPGGGGPGNSGGGPAAPIVPQLR